jgi:hypothetical protein
MGQPTSAAVSPRLADQLHNETTGSMNDYANEKHLEMKSIVSLQNEAFKNAQLYGERSDKSVDAHHPELNITEGGEFLDDSIRTREQPLLEKTKINPVSFFQ